MGALFSQLPAGQKIAEGTKLREQNKVLQKQAALHQRTLEGLDPNTNTGEFLDKVKAAKATADQIAENRKRQFELKPTDKTYGQYMDATKGGTQSEAYLGAAESRYKADMADKLFGNTHMQQEGLKQVKQRRNFNNYLNQLPTSLGGSVGELPANMRQQIASQYNKSQRRALMDKMDREAKK